jgi:two-component system cell cycle sensor histidine kinase/response regulator CckA
VSSREQRGDPGPELLQLLVDSAIDIVYRIRTVPTMAYEYISPSVEAILGYAPAEYYARPELGVLGVHPDDRAAIMDPATVPPIVRTFTRDGRQLHLEVRNRFLRDDAGALIAVEGVSRDVTERVRAEEAVRRSEANFRALIEFAPDLIFVTSLDGQIRYLNRAACTFAGRSADELIGKSALAIATPEDRQVAQRRLDTLRGGGALHDPIVYRALRADGSIGYAEFRSLAITWDGEPSSLGYGRDITESRALEARLAHSERMASLGTLAAGVAHEINNPLAYVTANLELALAALGGPEPADPTVLVELLRDAREGATRITRIVRDIRAVARPDPSGGAPAPVPVDVVAALDHALDLVDNRVRLRARVRRAIAPVPPVAGDEARLVQVFVNLLVNAAEALPEGEADRHEIRIEVSDDAGKVAIAIHDDGAGIPPDIASRIFDPFFTTKPVGTGMGLGLAICHGIVTAAGGDIQVTSQPGRGSTFRVRLPHAPPPSPAPSPSPAPPAPPPAATASPAPPAVRARILILDDEVILTRVLASALADDHDVVTATCARDALDLLQGGARFDVVFCDLMMPQMTGMDFYEALGEVSPEHRARIVFLTGGTFTEPAARFLRRVPNPRLEKPFPLTALDEAVRERLAATAAAT